MLSRDVQQLVIVACRAVPKMPTDLGIKKLDQSIYDLLNVLFCIVRFHRSALPVLDPRVRMFPRGAAGSQHDGEDRAVLNMLSSALRVVESHSAAL